MNFQHRVVGLEHRLFSIWLAGRDRVAKNLQNVQLHASSLLDKHLEQLVRELNLSLSWDHMRLRCRLALITHRLAVRSNVVLRVEICVEDHLFQDLSLEHDMILRLLRDLRGRFVFLLCSACRLAGRELEVMDCASQVHSEELLLDGLVNTHVLPLLSFDLYFTAADLTHLDLIFLEFVHILQDSLDIIEGRLLRIGDFHQHGLDRVTHLDGLDVGNFGAGLQEVLTVENEGLGHGDLIEADEVFQLRLVVLITLEHQSLQELV